MSSQAANSLASTARPVSQNLRPFKPGQSGNPGGRPKRLAELQALSQVNFPVAVERLAKLIQSQDEELAFRVIQFVFLYVLGKPAEATSLAHLEAMRARLTELVVSPSLPEPSPSPGSPLPETEVAPEAPLTEAPPVATHVQGSGVGVSPGFTMTPEREKLLQDLKKSADETHEHRKWALSEGIFTDGTVDPPKPQGLRCLFRSKDGQCSELAQDGKQWCPGHLAKLFEETK